MRMMNFRGLGWALLTSLIAAIVCTPSVQATDDAVFKKMADEAVHLLSEYLRIDTSNPPGNEMEAARFLEAVLAGEGIPCQIFESAPGRANLYARLEGSGKGRPVILLQHLDTVPADEPGWAVPPFGGVLQDGCIWGRGSIDMKGLGIAQLISFLALNRDPRELKRDVILLATADEEAGSDFGLRWFLENHKDLVAEAEFVLNEGGVNIDQGGDLAYVGIETAQKTPLWLRLTVRGGAAGHASTPRGTTAPARLVQALSTLLHQQPTPQVTPPVKDYFRAIAPYQPKELQQAFENLEEQLGEHPEILSTLSPFHRALVTNTTTLTTLRAGGSTNVIPSEAVAELDCRLVPGVNPEEFLLNLNELIDDPAVMIEEVLGFDYSPHSPSETEVFQAIRKALEVVDEKAQVGPAVLPGFTDSHFFREKGITAYGFSPFRLSGVTGGEAHAANERISEDDFRFGVRFLYEVVSRLTLGNETVPAARVFER
jgi:acetylornithine deacetylase/succinyl-diaminopimelate desuccinylase-like protein